MSRRRDETYAQWADRVDRQAAEREVREHLVYRAFDSYGLLLYIGCTANLTKRMHQHRRGPWQRFAETLGTVPYPSRSEALAAEKAAINSEASYFNATQADIQRTQANRNAAHQAIWGTGWYCPTVGPEVDHRDEEAWTAAWDAIRPEEEAWGRAVAEARARLKGSTHPFLSDEDRLARYLAARQDAELARIEDAA